MGVTAWREMRCRVWMRAFFRSAFWTMPVLAALWIFSTTWMLRRSKSSRAASFFQSTDVTTHSQMWKGYSQPGTPRLTQEEFVLNLVNLCVLEMPVHAIQTLKLLHSVFDLCKKIEVSVEAHLLFSFLILADESTAQSSFVFGFMVFSDANNMQRSCRCLVVFRTFEKSRLKESDPPKKRGLTLYRSRCEWFTDFMYLTSHENPMKWDVLWADFKPSPCGANVTNVTFRPL